MGNIADEFYYVQYNCHVSVLLFAVSDSVLKICVAKKYITIRWVGFCTWYCVNIILLSFSYTIILVILVSLAVTYGISDDVTNIYISCLCFSGSIELREDTVENLLSTACMLQLSEVVEACCNFLMKQLHPSNCIGIRQFADAQGCSDLYKVANNYVMVSAEWINDLIQVHESIKGNKNYWNEIIGRIIRNNIFHLKTVEPR